MTEQERAAALADEIAMKGLAFTGDAPHDLVGRSDEDIIVAALRLLAATPAATAVVTDEMVNRAFCVACCGPLVGVSDGQTYELRTPTMQTMRAALEAALKVKEPPAASSEVRERVARAQPDWWWCDIDPDECGDTPYEAMSQYRQRLVPVELSSSYVGPKYWGVMSPPMPGADDDSETDHVFDTLEEAQAFCAERRAAIAAAKEPTP